MIGKVISHYKILDKLGEGGMGVVYKAEDITLKRTVALKFLPPTLLAGEDDKKRFVREAQTAAALNHSNIATVFAIDEAEGQTFIALELVEGQSLDKKIASGPMKLTETLDIAVQICEGLQAAHEKGIVHRDIKCQNIMVTAKGQVKILDFGLAKLRGASLITKAGSTLGTMGYMSPEQLRGEPVDERADIWAVGVVLYEMIAGRRPFQGEFEDAVAYQILHQQPEPLTAIRTGVPMEIERVVNKLLSKNAADRYQGTTDLLVDLRALRRTIDPGIAQVPDSKRAPRRKRLLLGAGMLLLLIVTGVLYFALAPGPSGQIRSLAVLPLESLSRDKSQEWFADGMTEALTTEISKIGSLSVRSRTSAAQYKATTKSLPEIARELHVDAVIEGSALQIGDRVRITAQLIDANDRHLWAKEYDGSMADVLGLHHDISRAIAREINIALSPSDRARFTDPPRVVPAAFEADLRGRQALLSNRKTAEELQTAIGYFQQAVTLDTNFAQAYADLASSYLQLRLFGQKTPIESWKLAEVPNARALQINPQFPLAHLNLFYYKYLIAWDWNGARESLEKARELAPNDAEILYTLTDYYVFSGQFAKAIETSMLLTKQEPGTVGPWLNLAYAQYHSGDFDAALRTLEEALTFFPNAGRLYYFLSWNLTMKQRHPEAVEAARKAVAMMSSNPGVHAMSAWVFGRAGLRNEALKEITAIKKLGDRWIDPMWLGISYIGLGDHDRALDYIEEASREHSTWAVYIKRAPPFYVLRGNPRYEKLLLDMKLP